jgi:hypothetical protein
LEVTVTNGIADISAGQLKIYPNPAKEDIFIKSGLQIKKVELYTLSPNSIICYEFFVRNLPNISDSFFRIYRYGQ